MKHIVYMLIGIWLVMSSCSPTLSPYTNKIQNSLNLNDEKMKGIQFYLSEIVVLSREARQGDATVREGKIRIRNGRKVEEIIFEKGTQGVYLFSPKANHLAISFERDDNRYLIFGPNPKVRGKYVLLAKDWKDGYGKIRYGENIYQTSTLNARAGLEVDLDKIQKTTVKSRTAKGRSVKR